MNSSAIISFLLFLILLQITYKIRKIVYIKIGNSFKNYHDIPSFPLFCKNRNYIFKCIYDKRNMFYSYRAVIYNGNIKLPLVSNHSFNIIMTIEKLSQVKFMKDIGDGKSKIYHLAIDYRLFTNKYHIAYPVYSFYNLKEFLIKAKINYKDITSFMLRNGIVYIQKVGYKKRHILVKKLMKYINIDSYGKDLNNKEWPNTIPRSNKIDIIKKYKFCLAIENSVVNWLEGSKFEASEINNDYVTEKLTDCLLAGSIPIYFGARNVDVFIPHPDSIINFNQFKTIKDLSIYISRIMNSSSMIFVHTQWHNNYSQRWFKRFNNVYRFNYCKICERVNIAY